jgi:hypothetical protein
MKRVFSLNVISYLKAHDVHEIDIGFDSKTKKVYYVFDESDVVVNLIANYRSDGTQVNLRDFITQFKNVKEDIARHLKVFGGKNHGY